MNFKTIATAVAKQFQFMTTTGTGLFRTDADKDQLWDLYLSSFPAGSNPVYRTRTEHDCQCCRSFVRTLGGVVTIVDNTPVTIWDIRSEGALVDTAYQVVAEKMTAFVRSQTISNIFLHTERCVGTQKSRMLIPDSEEVVTWDHFFVNLPTDVVVRGEQIGPNESHARSTYDVMLRGLRELDLESVNTVLDLIAQNSLYRGEEHRAAVDAFRKLKTEFTRVTGELEQQLFVWSRIKSVIPSVARIRNTAIGTLLVNLASGMELEPAVKAFETVVAPANYKRPTALVTKAMIERARQTIAELGLTSALERRYATIDDITINNILYADRQTRKEMNVFEQLAATSPENPKKLDKVEEISIEDFIANVLPKATSLEVMFENKHSGNLVSLVAPADPTANGLFKWPNNFSWSYTGDLTDSIKERVKQAGGKVDGDFRASLSWFNYDDLDLHLEGPGGMHIYFGCKKHYETGGVLDVDMNAGSRSSKTPVENIVFPERARMRPGSYRLYVYQFHKREATDVGFEVELEFDGVVHSFNYPKALKHHENVTVCEFSYDSKNGITFQKSLPSSQASKTVWGLPTQTFHKVNVLMLSPNYWNERAVGNKHYFFMLDGCKNDGQARGFFNEFLNESLSEHRKVLEIVGSKMKTEESDRQLSGLGFSSTQRNHLLCRVKGTFSRVVKIVF